MMFLCSAPMNPSAVFPKATASRQRHGKNEQQGVKKKKKKGAIRSLLLFIMFDQGVYLSSFFNLDFFLSFIKMQCPLVDSIWASFPSLPDNING